MSRMDEIIEIENRMEFYFQDLESDINFTEEQIRQFHSDWQRLNQLDLPERRPKTKRLIYLLLCIMIICTLCFIIAMSQNTN